MPTTAGVSKYFARGNRIVFAGWGFGSVFRDLHRELQSTHCPATGKTQNAAERSMPVRVRPPAPRRSKVRFAPTSFCACGKKDVIRPLPCHPFQIEPAVLGFDLGMGADWRAAASMLLRCIKNPERKRVRDFVLFERARGRGGVSAPWLICPRAAGVSGWPPGCAFG